jgi:thiamine biosynthesis lipoprotein
MSTPMTPARRVVRLRPPRVDQTFRALGTDVRLIAEGFNARTVVANATQEILEYHDRLSRFISSSELSALNDDPRSVVPASSLLRAAVSAGLWAAERSGGLVDPCLLDALIAAGYDTSFEPAEPIAPPSARPRPAAPHADAAWRSIRVDDRAGTIERPPRLRFDLGGSGKGHVADLVTDHFAELSRWVVDCGGDIRVGGSHEIQAAHPLGGGPAVQILLTDGAIATSSIVGRAWRTAEGTCAHHLLDPSTGRPAWTGLLCATALAPTALHAETLAKTALLRGPEGARRVLNDLGGLIVHHDGEVEAIGPLPRVPR